MYKTKRMRLKNALVDGKEFREVSQVAMDAVTEYFADAAPDNVPTERIVEAVLHLESLLRWKVRNGEIDADDVQQIEDAILLREEQKNESN